MKTIEVVSPGLFTTVQDLGREGFGPMGVSPSGAADTISLRIGNRLVGNPESLAALEMTLLGGTFLFHERAVVALTGSDFGATLNDTPVGLWSSIDVNAGRILCVGPTRSGARCYLSVQGGIVVKPFLNSASTHILSGTGGFAGRALKKSDVLQIGKASEVFTKKTVASAVVKEFSVQKVLRVTAGPQSDWFSQAAQKTFCNGSYRVTEECNRMGLRLDGPAIEINSDRSMISEGVSLGAVQITTAGLPIILFVEQQTAGGYPQIANVISADMHSVGQLRPRDEIRFELVDFETARNLLLEQEKLMASPELIEE